MQTTAASEYFLIHRRWLVVGAAMQGGFLDKATNFGMMDHPNGLSLPTEDD